MTHPRTAKVLAAFLALGLLAGACSREESSSGGGDGSGTEGEGAISTSDCPDTGTAGIEGDTIKLVSSFPQSGLTAPFSEISKGWKAYFQYTNDQGGVEIAGKKYMIETEDKDDMYNAAETSSNIRELMGPDYTQAFAVFNVVGTTNNLAIRQSLGDECVPDVFAATGSPAFGNPEFPWLIGSTLAPYTLEGKVFAEYLMENDPDAKVAMLVQDDDFGAAYEQGFRRAIEGTDIEIAKVEKYPVAANDVSAQVTSLAATNADAFFNGGTLLACPDAFKKAKAAGWEPTIYVSGTCISKTLMGIAGADADGALSITNIMDPLNPMFADDENMQLYREQVAKYQPDADLDNGIVAYGWTQAAILVQAMMEMPELTRANLMGTLRSLDGVEGGLLLPDVSISTSEEDAFMGETVQLIQYDAAAKYFNNVGELQDFEGQTAELTPDQLIEG